MIRNNKNVVYFQKFRILKYDFQKRLWFSKNIYLYEILTYYSCDYSSLTPT